MSTSFNDLLEKYLTETLTVAEKKAFMEMLADDASLEILQASIGRYASEKSLLLPEDEVLKKLSYERLQQQLGQVAAEPPADAMPTIPARRRLIPRWYWAAAASVLLFSAGAYFWLNRPKPVTGDQQLVSSDIRPGRDGAILTLSDGTQVVLDSLANGLVAKQSGSQVLLKDGQLAYDASEATATKASAIVYNTMSTPKGRQFNLQLPDGTKVWLNAASSLRFPTVFSGKERRVEITGEAYFEVVQNAKQPFLVSVDGGAAVEVLGTSFNVNAYDNEASINTTLLEGRVRVTKTGSQKAKDASSANDPSVILQPGQQAQLFTDRATQPGQPPNRPIAVVTVNVEKTMAWKNGLFNFEGEGLRDVMRQLERWYDIEVVYERGVPDITFGGEITRGVSLQGLLSGLEGSEVHFRIEGRKLIVLP
ncbi:MAG: FecR domain-containing protein [Candidatus Pseudobacter hemicellulosilyticus]|uniref:FecR domain-containing protein n=1 Tax=Candidatus Pseudobacter hemicellulosilyticus TaxID=3121375 RepID=A0AAJ6BHH1_9BACT|nr:MAG: FecR domain-containing protein [Pseudobacter sp.]